MSEVFDVRRVGRATGLLREFNDAGVLVAADVHVALRLCGLAGVEDEAVALAVALAVRAPRLGHVLVDLATADQTLAVDADEPVDLSSLPWPNADAWVAAVAASPLVGSALQLEGSCLYLDRYWREERQLASDLLALGADEPPGVDHVLARNGVARLFPGQIDGRQAAAATAAVERRFTVIAGGPGTGKTTTVARVVAMLCEQAAVAGERPPLVALAAPTGKAAARLEEAVHEEAPKLAVDESIRDQLLGLSASTLHRLLGWRPDSHSRFRHDRRQRLPYDVVIVDESSMVSLSLMARLVEAVRPSARLVLVGDPGQLASIEAGAVLGDIVGSDPEPPPGIVVLSRVHRYGEGVAAVAEAIRRGDADAVIAALSAGHPDVTWIPDDDLSVVRAGATAAAREVFDAARSGDAREALAALGTYRILCAHRRGPQGVATWTEEVERWLTAEVPGFSAQGPWYVGRPLLVTSNDYELQLYNGDVGVIVQSTPDRVTAAFERRGEILEYSPTRLSAIDTVHAMTIHKSQGSQFDTAAVLLPDADSRILTRELLYTAATRARKRLLLIGTQEKVRAASGRPVARASGLGARLSGASEDNGR